MENGCLDDCQITVTFRVIPYCNHLEFDSTCLWCADALRVYRELQKLPQQYVGHSNHTRVIVVEAINPLEP